VNYKKRRPAKRRGAAALCWCNPHQQAIGNTRGSYYATRQQKREGLIRREEMR